MFTFFKKKSVENRLRSQYNKLMVERNKLLQIDKRESNSKFNEAQRVLNQIESLKNAF